MDHSHIRIVARNAVSSDQGRPDERGIVQRLDMFRIAVASSANLVLRIVA